jgi:hypothetical protein
MAPVEEEEEAAAEESGRVLVKGSGWAGRRPP